MSFRWKQGVGGPILGGEGCGPPAATSWGTPFHGGQVALKTQVGGGQPVGPKSWACPAIVFRVASAADMNCFTALFNSPGATSSSFIRSSSGASRPGGLELRRVHGTHPE